MTKAKFVRVGDRLMNAKGKSVLVTSVDKIPYEGKVWNVQPLSKNRIENILIAGDFLSGSVRFQNEWAMEAYRLSLRDEIDASILD